ncbi:efflux RND transporter periplasmic adaptor subunit [bacterium]|nr:efflux RND transporter periplasmic adaptor subunit [bacterium]
MNGLSKLFQYKFTYLIIGMILCFILIALFSGGNHNHSAMQANGSVEAQSSPTIWTCSMHPQIRKTEPGKCPICGMDLIPASSAEDDSGPRTLTMSEAAKALAEIQTVSVQRKYVEHELSLVGKVEYDETRLKYITAWFPGRLDRLFVDYTGTPVNKGDHLVEIYSPSIITDQESLIQAKKAVSSLSESTVPNVLSSRKITLERARERLRLLGLTNEQIKSIEESGSTTDDITFFSPINGIVIHKNALEGDYVQTGTRIYTIADLSVVWMKMDAYESDLQWIHYGQEVEFTTISYPGEVFKGRVSFIDPFLDDKTRTIKVRVNVENSDGKLKPEMFVRATVRSKVNADGNVYDQQLAGKWISPMHPEIVKDHPGTCDICGMPLVKAESLGFVGPADADNQPPLVVPASAPLITGKRSVVYVKVPDAEKPTYEGREVTLGARLKDYYIVSDGLNEGEEVVVKGNFKIDSALQIQAKPSMMSADAVDGSTEGGDMSAMSKSKTLTLIPNESVADFTKAYQAIYEAFVKDDLSGAQAKSKDWVAVSQKYDLKNIEMLGHGVMHANNIDEARQAFKKIADVMIQSYQKYGTQNDKAYVIHCPMAMNNQGADWLQWQLEVRNPYFGDAMLTCGELQKTIEPHSATEESKNSSKAEGKQYSTAYLNKLLDQYKSVSNALTQDDLDGAKQAAQQIKASAQDQEDFSLNEFAEKIINAIDISQARLAFAVISNILIDAVQTNNPTGSNLYSLHCPMAFNNQGADWLQWQHDTLNPYFGEAMLKCGSVTATIPPSQTDSKLNSDHSSHQ